MHPKHANQLKADFLLLLVAMVWGLTFVSVKSALLDIKPYTFNAVRFITAFFFLLLFLKGKVRQVSGASIKWGLLIGTMLFAGYSLQTIGLQYTTAANAGFITGLSVVMVPLLARLLFGTPTGGYALMGALTAALGLGLLSLNLPLGINLGDLLILLCAAAFAMHIVLVGRFSPFHDTAILVTTQVGTVALLSLVFAIFVEGQAPVFTPNVLWGLAVTAIPATALAYFIQNWAQRFTTAARTAIILSMEPVFAALFAFLLLGESLTGQDAAGGLLVLTGMLLAERG